MATHSRTNWLILFISFVLSVLLITFFLKILKGILLLGMLVVVMPLMYWLVRSFITGSKRLERHNKLKERP